MPIYRKEFDINFPVNFDRQSSVNNAMLRIKEIYKAIYSIRS